MNKVQRIRNQILSKKRHSIFNLGSFAQRFNLPISIETNMKIDSELNCSLFPLLNVVEPPVEYHEHVKQNVNVNTINCQNILKAFSKEQKAKQKKIYQINMIKTIQEKIAENDSALIAKPFQPSIRIYRTYAPRNRNIKTQKLIRLSNTTQCNKTNKNNSQRLSQKNGKRLSRCRKTISSAKQLSPQRNYSISAWNTEKESEF